MTAAQLIAALEHSVSALPMPDGRFPQLSSSLQVSANFGRPPLEGMAEVTEPSRIEFLIVIPPGGAPDVVVQAYAATGDLSRTFTIATSSILHNDATGGFKSVAAGQTVAMESMSEQQAMQDYIMSEMGGTVSLEDPPTIPRLTLTNRA